MEKIETGEYIPTKLEEGSELARPTEQEIAWLNKAKYLFEEGEKLKKEEASLERKKITEENLPEFVNRCDEILNNLGYKKLINHEILNKLGDKELINYDSEVSKNFDTYIIKNIEKNGYVIHEIRISLNKSLSSTGEITRINYLEILGVSEFFERYFTEEFWRDSADYDRPGLDSPVELDSENYDENIKKIYDELISAF